MSTGDWRRSDGEDLDRHYEGRPAAARVLLVEDEPLARETMAEALHGAGLAVAAAASAEAAFGAAEAAAELPLAVLVTDLDLAPDGLDGLALAAAARRRWPGLGVVYVTGRPSNLDGHALGARDRFLPKPLAPTALVRAVRSLVAIPPRRATRGWTAHHGGGAAGAATEEARCVRPEHPARARPVGGGGGKRRGG